VEERSLDAIALNTSVHIDNEQDRFIILCVKRFSPVGSLPGRSGFILIASLDWVGRVVSLGQVWFSKVSAIRQIRYTKSVHLLEHPATLRRRLHRTIWPLANLLSKKIQVSQAYSIARVLHLRNEQEARNV
jgi:hypothetical protein